MVGDAASVRAVDRTFEVAEKGATAAIKVITAVAVIGGCYVGYIWWSRGGSSGLMRDANRTLNQLAQLPMKLAKGFFNDAERALMALFQTVKNWGLAAADAVGQDIGYTNRTGLFAAWFPAGDKWPVGVRGSDIDLVRGVYAAQAKYDLSKERLYLPAFMKPLRLTNGVPTYAYDVNVDRQLDIPGFSAEGNRTVAAKRAVTSYQQTAKTMVGGYANLMFMIGRELGLSSEYKAVVAPAMANPDSPFWGTIPGAMRAEKQAMMNGYNTASLPLAIWTV